MHYIADILAPFNINVSTLAHGVPVGGELDYLDDGTLHSAFVGRRCLDAA
jgi:recombination protein RecR